MIQRIQKYLSTCGIASRRKAEELVLNGRVKVNGNIIKEIVQIDDEVDIVEVDGIKVKSEKHVYILLNKPVGVITSSSDQFSRKTVLDIVDTEERVYPVGRLDYDTSGLIILTNDGETANKITHPSHRVDKVYIAEVIGYPDSEEQRKFREGLEIEGKITAPASIELLNRTKRGTVLRICIHEGRNRQVRKMCECINHPVLSLKRVAVGELKIDGLSEGQWRYMNKEEIDYIRSL